MTQEQLKGLAGRLKERRKQLGITQERAAELLEMTYSSYSKIENAFQQPGIDMLIRISDVFSLSLDYLIFGGECRKVVTISDKTKESIRDVAEILKLLES